MSSETYTGHWLHMHIGLLMVGMLLLKGKQSQEHIAPEGSLKQGLQ